MPRFEIKLHPGIPGHRRLCRQLEDAQEQQERKPEVRARYHTHEQVSKGLLIPITTFSQDRFIPTQMQYRSQRCLSIVRRPDVYSKTVENCISDLNCYKGT